MVYATSIYFCAFIDGKLNKLQTTEVLNEAGDRSKSARC